MKKDIQYWLDLADYDLKTAEAMLEGGRYLYVLFTCEQTIEKMFKGLIVKSTGEFPPRIHDLIKLSQLAKVELGVDYSDFLRKLTLYYIETRYPQEISELSRDISRDIAVEYLQKTKEVYQWLKKKL